LRRPAGTVTELEVVPHLDVQNATEALREIATAPIAAMAI
jgi:hypothetical protein